jgi:hypothetical protein
MRCTAHNDALAALDVQRSTIAMMIHTANKAAESPPGA